MATEYPTTPANDIDNRPSLFQVRCGPVILYEYLEMHLCTPIDSRSRMAVVMMLACDVLGGLIVGKLTN
jgi:hypothetical protein